MTPYIFPGYPVFLEDAAKRIGRPEAEVPARRIATLAALANLCAQAGSADPADAPGIMAKAADFRDQLHAAYKAAELMLDEVHRALGLASPVTEDATGALESSGRYRSARPRKS